MICDTVRPVYWAGWGIFLAISGLCWLFGAQRGIPLRKLNFHVVSFCIYLLITWYSAGSVGYMCWEGVERDDGEVDVVLARPLIAATILATVSVLITHRLDEPAIDVLMHACMAIASQIFWILSIVSFDGAERFFWAWTSIGFASILLLHLWAEGRSRDCASPKFARALIVKVFLYVLVYYIISLWGPYMEDLIGPIAQEVVLMINDTFINLSVCVSVLHYGWAERSVNRSPIKPDVITQLWVHHRVECNQLTQSLHVIQHV